MYEKPLYPTPDGYRRKEKNPYKKSCLKDEVMAMMAQKARLQKNTLPTTGEATPGSEQIPPKTQLLNKSKKKVQLSDKAANLIAQTIKSLLRSK